MSDEGEKRPPLDPLTGDGLPPEPPEIAEYRRRVEEAKARGEDPAPIVREMTLDLLERLRKKFADRE